MPTTIKIYVTDLPTVLESYTHIKVYKSETVDGTYVEATEDGTRVLLNEQDTIYTYIDTAGTTDRYKIAYYNDDTEDESDLSEALPDPSYIVQLQANMQVIVTLSNAITDTLGNPLSDDSLQYYFTTSYVPLYSSVRKVRLEIGSFVQNLDDDAINFAIFEASLAADQLSWITSTSDFYKWARREWVTCMAAHQLLANVISGLKSKRLDNFDVTYDFEKRGQAMLDKTQACMDKWLVQLQSGGAGVQKPVGFVKGELDPDDPHVGRMWEKGPYVDQTPMANLRYRPYGSRRYVAGFKRAFNKMR